MCRSGLSCLELSRPIHDSGGIQLSLDVHLHGRRVGGLFPLGEDAYSFAYTAEAVEEFPPGKALLSNSLPLRAEPFGPDTTRAYVEGHLPQGTRREVIAAEPHLRPLVPRADALCPARRASQACPRLRRARRSLGLATGRHAQHPHNQARAARPPRFGCQ